MSLFRHVTREAAGPVAVLNLAIAMTATPISAWAQGRILAPEPSGLFTQFLVSPTPASPHGIAVDANRELWVTLAGANAIARVSGELGSARVRLAEYAIPTPNAFPQGIAVRSDGSVWFAELRGGKIGRLDPANGDIREYSLPDPRSGPVWIAISDDGNIWFTEAEAGRIGVLEPSTGSIREFSIPTPNAVPLSIRRAPDGTLWFPEHEGNKIGRLDPVTGEIREFPIPTIASGPADIAFAPDGSVWFTELDGGKIGRLDPATGGIREFPLANARTTRTSGPAILAWGPDGALWFTEMYGNRLGRIDTRTFRISRVQLPSPARVSGRRVAAIDADDDRPASLQSDGPASLIAGPDGTLWYTAMYGNKLGRFEPLRR